MANKPQDDTMLVVLFKNDPVLNPLKSAKEGRPIYDDREICEIRIPGSRDMKPFPAHDFAPQKIIDIHTGIEKQLTYAERFNTQYRQFKTHAQQTQAGTPLEFAPFVTPARRMELRALFIYTIEALAQLDGQELKNIGPLGRELKNQAQAYLETSKDRAVDTAMMAEMEAMRAKLQVLEEDNAALKAKAQAIAAGEGNFDDMTTEQLQTYVEDRTGHPLQGTMQRKTLLRMALDLKAQAKAA